MITALIFINISPLQSAGASCEGHVDPPLPPAGDRRLGLSWAVPHREAPDPWAVDPWGKGHPSSLWCRPTPRGPASVPGWTLESVSPTADPAPGLGSVDLFLTAEVNVLTQYVMFSVMLLFLFCRLHHQWQSWLPAGVPGGAGCPWAQRHHSGLGHSWEGLSGLHPCY